MAAEQTSSDDDAVMDPRRFFSHELRVHRNRQALSQVFAQQAHWVFAMTAECGRTALPLSQLHLERCGEPITIVAACCLARVPAFFLFPRAHLAFDEFGPLLDIQVAASQAEAEQMHYFALAMHDARPLAQALERWIHTDHLLS
jgi:hypothetical protein